MKQILLAFSVLILVIAGGLITTNALAPKNANFALGSEKDLSLLSKGVKWIPDGHISYVTLPKNVRRYFISGNQKTYIVDSPSLSLTEALSKNSRIKEVFGPDKNIPYRNFYATIDSALQTDAKDLNHLMAFAQYEQQAVKSDGTNDYSAFTSSIGLLESFDGGETWKDLGPVIRGDDYLPPGTKVTGAGQPSAIIKDGFVYVYFIDWASGAKISHPDEIYLARTKISPEGGLGTFEYLSSNGLFYENISAMKPVITIPQGSDAGYISLPGVSYNKYLKQYLAIFETNIGFYRATSADGIKWDNEQIFLTFDKPQSDRQEGDAWISYPSLLSDNSEKTDGTTGKTGNLYYGKGIWPNTAHELTVVPFELK